MSFARAQGRIALASLVALIGAAGCGGAGDASAPDAAEIGTTREAITNSADDATDPGVVALLLGGQILCTGFLVTSRVVVTAGHCIQPSPPDTVYFGADPSSKTGTFIKVADAQSHPDFDPDSLANDVGVIGLADKAPTAPLAVLSERFDPSFVGLPLRLVGFGQTSSTASALRKHVGASTLDAYSDATFTFKPEPSQTCEGDSGGPAFTTLGGKELVVGITSSGDTDCKLSAKDTRMDPYVGWVTGYAKAYKAPEAPAAKQGCAAAPRSAGAGPRGTWLAIVLGCGAALRARRGARRATD